MYTRRNIRWSLILKFAMTKVIVFSVWASFITWLFLSLKAVDIDCSMPLAPLGTIGVAVAFYVGFKNNQSYDRFWEARKIWGGIVNTSRSWGNLVMGYVSAANAEGEVDKKVVDETRRTLIYRHLAWLTALRYQLRRKTQWGFTPKGLPKKFVQPTDIEALKQQSVEFLGESEVSRVCSMKNAATQIIRTQGEQLRQLIEEKPRLIEEFRYIALNDLLTEMYTLQGKCERIKNTPFPRQYAYFSAVFVWIFCALLPLGIVGAFAERGLLVWMTVPLSVIISWIFFTMETVGDTSEDPFENFVNDVPMTALCRTIEIDLKQMLGETDLPEPIAPVNDILM
ncbi:MAG: bestrophin family ion channel [Pseudomonadota bacterium]